MLAGIKGGVSIIDEKALGWCGAYHNGEELGSKRDIHR
jgi:hypothetical protein